MNAALAFLNGAGRTGHRHRLPKSTRKSHVSMMQLLLAIYPPANLRSGSGRPAGKSSGGAAFVDSSAADALRG